MKNRANDLLLFRIANRPARLLQRLAKILQIAITEFK